MEFDVKESFYARQSGETKENLSEANENYKESLRIIKMAKQKQMHRRYLLSIKIYAIIKSEIPILLNALNLIPTPNLFKFLC